MIVEDGVVQQDGITTNRGYDQQRVHESKKIKKQLDLADEGGKQPQASLDQELYLPHKKVKKVRSRCRK